MGTTLAERIDIEYLATLIADYADPAIDDFHRGEIRGRVGEYVRQNATPAELVDEAVALAKAEALHRHEAYLDGLFSRVTS